MTQIKDLSPVDYASTNDQIPVYRPDRGDTRKMTVGQIYAYVVAQQGAQGSTSWGTITGTLSAQTDLQTALDGKQPVGNYQPLATVLTNTTASFTTAQETKLAGIAANFASQTANTFLAAPNGAPGVPTFRAIVAADVPTLNQNTTGSAATLATSRNFSISGGGITAAAVGFNGSAAVTLSASVDAGHITPARMADVATASVFYRKTAGTGAPEVQTLATLKTDLGLTGTNSGDQTITLTGDVTGSGTGSFAATLATVNSNVGTFGSATLVPVVTVNAKGLITAISTIAVSGGSSSFDWGRTNVASSGFVAL